MISKLKIHSQIPIPKVGKKINIFVSFVVDVDRFYAQIIPKNCKSVDDLPAVKLLEKMNNSEFVSKLRKFDRPPGKIKHLF